MNKSLIGTLLGAVCMALSGASPVAALDLYGFGSYWDKGDVDGRWGGGIGLSLPLFTDHLRLDARVYFFENSTFGEDDELTLTPFDLGVQVHLLPDATLNPYILGGVSLLYADADRIDVDSDLGGYLGGGLEWSMLSSTFKLFGEVLYRFQELEAGGVDDIDASGMSGNVGVKVSF